MVTTLFTVLQWWENPWIKLESIKHKTCYHVPNQTFRDTSDLKQCLFDLTLSCLFVSDWLTTTRPPRDISTSFTHFLLLTKSILHLVSGDYFSSITTLFVYFSKLFLTAVNALCFTLASCLISIVLLPLYPFQKFRISRLRWNPCFCVQKSA